MFSDDDYAMSLDVIRVSEIARRNPSPSEMVNRLFSVWEQEKCGTEFNCESLAGKQVIPEPPVVKPLRKYKSHKTSEFGQKESLAIEPIAAQSAEALIREAIQEKEAKDSSQVNPSPGPCNVVPFPVPDGAKSRAVKLKILLRIQRLLVNLQDARCYDVFKEVSRSEFLLVSSPMLAYFHPLLKTSGLW